MSATCSVTLYSSRCNVALLGSVQCHISGFFTSNIVSDTSPEAASPGYEDPLKDLPVYTTWLHDDDWTQKVKERPCAGSDPILSDLISSNLISCVS